MSFQAIADVINGLRVKGSRKGVSRTAIKNGLPDVTAARVGVALKKAVAAGKLTQVGQSFKVVEAVKKAAPKKAAPKKKATKKKKKAGATAAPPQRARATPVRTPAAPPAGGGGSGPSAGVIVEKSGLQGKGAIYYSGSDLYDIDISFSGGTSNKFYKMQIVEMKAKKQGFSLVQNWGPIGKAGQVKVTEYKSVAGAVAEMEKIFKKKSGLAFADRNSGVAVGGKYAVMQQRRQAAGGKEGKLTVSLMWDNAHGVQNDLDLWVVCPGGEKIDYANKCAGGGELDVDRQRGDAEPVENIYWAKTPPKGSYQIIVQNYSQGAAVKVPFTVSITTDGETELIEKIMPANIDYTKQEIKIKTLKF